MSWDPKDSGDPKTHRSGGNGGTLQADGTPLTWARPWLAGEEEGSVAVTARGQSGARAGVGMTSASDRGAPWEVGIRSQQQRRLRRAPGGTPRARRLLQPQMWS